VVCQEREWVREDCMGEREVVGNGFHYEMIEGVGK